MKLNIMKSQLRKIARMETEIAVIEAAHNKNSHPKKQEIQTLFKQILGVDSLAAVEIAELHAVLQPDSLLERFAYRRQTGMAGNSKDFIKLKGTRGQIDHDETVKVENENEQLGFKCLHYSVTESNGNVELTIIKKVQQEITFGYRTIADSATAPKDYTHTEEIVQMKKRDTEHKILIPIVDDEEWEPDLDFFVELFDPNDIGPDNKPKKMTGDDTKCKVTILDEDCPGKLGFEMTDVRVSKRENKVDITVVRSEGADGTISCMIRTEPLSETNNPSNAIEFDDYLPKHEKLTFGHGENEKTIQIMLVKEKL